jgi:FlaA1/EpsC-like NDP-sugar epimerase
MGSRGSVIPFFLKQKDKGFLPITDERMTRFNITLNSGVEFVLSSLERMWGGEIFVPKIPSYKITDIAQAIAPDTPVKVIGIRPGEKLHEEMISKDDAVNTIEYKDYFSILPVSEYLSWDVKDFLDSKDDGEQCSEGFEYNSFLNEHFLTVEELKELIENQT